MKKIQNTILNLVVVVLLAGCCFAATLPAALDPSFGLNGIVGLGGRGVAADITVDSSDRIIEVNEGSILSLRGTDGATTSGIRCPFASCHAVVLQPRDYVVVIGVTGLGELALTRLDPNLNTDFSFGTNGIVTIGAGLGFFAPRDAVNSINGDIIITGQVSVSSSWRQFVARIDNNGNPRTTFGIGGYVIEPPSLYIGRSIAYRKGNIIIGGSGTDLEGKQRTTVTVYTETGARQTSFNNGNPLYLYYGWDAVVAVQPDNKIIAANTLQNGATHSQLSTVRVNPDGSLDLSFGINGYAPNPIGPRSAPYTRVAADVEIDPFGRIIIVGVLVGGYMGYPSGQTIERYLPSGAPDLRFTYPSPAFNDGKGWRFYLIDPSLGNSFNALAFQRNGNIVVAGHTATSTNIFTSYVSRFFGN